MRTDKDFYYEEWQNAEKNGNKSYASGCKEKYRELVLESIIKPYHFYTENLKRFPMINLN